MKFSDGKGIPNKSTKIEHFFLLSMVTKVEFDREFVREIRFTGPYI